jgi:hypothetical protein
LRPRQSIAQERRISWPSLLGLFKTVAARGRIVLESIIDICLGDGELMLVVFRPKAGPQGKRTLIPIAGILSQLSTNRSNLWNIRTGQALAFFKFSVGARSGLALCCNSVWQ